FTWAVFSSVNKKVTTNYSPLMTTLFQFLIMLIILLPFTFNRESLISVLQLSKVGWISILFLGIFCSGVAYVLWAQSLKAMDSAKVGAFLYIEPFVTVITAWILLSEHITTLIIASGLIITFGVYLVNRD
ncbi:MAG: DMT family transporter, partial [Ignavibacteria bacterium]|nr:DMT family transporter [Ignavibacteria bacterium]